MGQAYAGFDFANLLSVKGDPVFNPSAVQWAVDGALPAGMSLDVGGVLRGTPAAGGSFSFVLAATYAGKSGQQIYSLPVQLRVELSLAATAPLSVPQGEAFSFDFTSLLTVSGDQAYQPGHASWQLRGGLPAGLSFNAATGRLSGATTALSNDGVRVSLQASYQGESSEPREFQLLPSDRHFASVPILLHMDQLGVNSGSAGEFSAVGTEVSRPTVVASGRYAGCTNFSGVGGTGLIGPPVSLVGDFTIEVMVRPTRLGTLVPILGQWTQQNDSTGGYLLVATTSGVKFYWGAYSTAGNGSMLSGPGLPLNTWSHLKVTREGALFRLFVNDIQATSITYGGAGRNLSVPVTVGSYFGRFGELPADGETTFQGCIDELRVTTGAARQGTMPSAPYPDR